MKAEKKKDNDSDITDIALKEVVTTIPKVCPSIISQLNILIKYCCYYSALCYHQSSAEKPTTLSSMAGWGNSLSPEHC